MEHNKAPGDVVKLQERLGKENIGKLLREFSVPATIGMLVNALYNVIDRMFIGLSEDLASLGLAALSVSFPIMMIMMGLALMFGAGGAFLFMILALSNLEGLLRLFGASEESLPMAKSICELYCMPPCCKDLR